MGQQPVALDEVTAGRVVLADDDVCVCAAGDGLGQQGGAQVRMVIEPPPIPSNEANLTPWTKSNFLAVEQDTPYYRYCSSARSEFPCSDDLG